MTGDVSELLRAPRVFVSYSHDSEHHRERVLALSEALRSFGVDATIDRYFEVPPPASWPAWMHDQLETADLVIVVCSETYERRLLGREIPGRGLGVRWEGSIITQQAYEEDRHRFIPVVLDTQHRRYIPYFLRSTTHYMVDPRSKKGLEPLLRRIFNEPEVLPTPLGVRPRFPMSPPSQVQERHGDLPSTTVGPHLPFAQAADRAIRAIGAARAGLREQAMLALRKSLQEFARDLSRQVNAPCRGTVLLVHEQVADDGSPNKFKIMVQPTLTSTGQPLAGVSYTLESSEELRKIWYDNLDVYVDNDLDAKSGYVNPQYSSARQYRSVIVWPLPGPSYLHDELGTFFGFLTAECTETGPFDAQRDTSAGLLYAALVSTVLQDLMDPPAGEPATVASR